ncbi:MAG: DUF2914 domain-containing protein [Candidatus Zixiibacteriota bacterium]
MIKKIILMFGFIVLTFSFSLKAQEEIRTESFTDLESSLCTNVEERMPIGIANSFSSDVERVYLWTKVTGAVDSTFIKHVWIFNGVEMAAVELPVRGSSWRTWSYKTILPIWIGDWEVKILDASGNILKSVSFTINKSKELPAEKPEPEKPSDSI